MRAEGVDGRRAGGGVGGVVLRGLGEWVAAVEWRTGGCGWKFGLGGRAEGLMWVGWRRGSGWEGAVDGMESLVATPGR